MYYPGGMKARVSPVQSIKPRRMLAPTRDSNQEPLGPQSRVVTTICTTAAHRGTSSEFQRGERLCYDVKCMIFSPLKLGTRASVRPKNI